MELAAIGTVLAAMGGVLKLVLDHLKRMDEAHNAAIKDLQRRQELFLGNHMSANTKAMQDVAQQLERLTDDARAAHIAAARRTDGHS